MNWIIASLLMFASSVALYLFVRKSNELKTPQQFNNLAMFLIPVVVYLFLSIKTKPNFHLTSFEYALIVIQGIFFSYLGNKFSLKGIENAPNPGYSLIISKSYVAFTVISSIFLFQSTLTLKSAISILCIIIFSAFITVNKDKKQVNSNYSWLLFTFGAFFCWGFLALSSKLLLNMGVPILSRLILSMIIVTILISGEIVVKRISFKKMSKAQIVTLIFIGIFGSSYAYFLQVGLNLAPNVGYVNAANAASISLLTLLSAFIFKDELSTKKLIGIVGVTLGLLLLFLN